MKLNKGDIFKIKTTIGFGFIQYIETDDSKIEFVRILNPISKDGEISQSEVNEIERWSIGFPLKIAIRRKIVEKVGNYEIPRSFKNYEYTRSIHKIQGETLGWYIVNKTTLQRKLKKKLDKEDLKLSPSGIMNDTLIIEYLETNWKLGEWK